MSLLQEYTIPFLLLLLPSCFGDAGQPCATIQACEVSADLQSVLEALLLDAQLAISREAPPRCTPVPKLSWHQHLTNLEVYFSEEECEIAISHASMLLTSQLRVLQGLPDAIIITPDQLPGQIDRLQSFQNELRTLLSDLWEEARGGVLPISLARRWECFQQIVDERLLQVENMRALVEADRVRHLAALLKPTSLTEGEAYFHLLNNNTFIPLVMEALYPDDEYSLNLAGFALTVLRTMPQRLVAYQKWFQLVMDAGHLITNRIVVLRKALQVEISDADESSRPPELVELKNKTELYMNAVITSWARLVELNNYTALLDFSIIPRTERAGDMFDELLPELIEKVYGDDPTRLSLVNKFIAALRRNIHKATALGKLLDLTKTSGDLQLLVAINIKETIDQLDTSSSDLARERFQNLSAEVPQLQRALLWSSVCYFSVRDSITGVDQSLYADTNDYLGSSGNERNIYVTGETRGDERRFRITYKVTDSQVTYNIAVDDSSIDEKYLDERIGGTTPPSEFRKVPSVRCAETDFNWVVEQVDGLKVKLKHSKLNGYLMAYTVDENNSNRRKVVIWTHPVLQPTDHIWDLLCYE